MPGCQPERRRGSLWRLAAVAASLPLFAGCAVVGYPSPRVPSAGPAGERAPASAPVHGPVVLSDAPRPDASPVDLAASRPIERYEVFGETYTVMASAEGYVQRGVASWYGQEFAGRPTSSGEIFDPRKLTAAHRSLPLDTWVEVTNLRNGRKVVLKVNDRGPFAETEDRIIDVSYEAARLLGLVGPGTGPVEVRALPADAGGSLRRR